MGSKDLDTKRKQESSGMPSLVEFWSGQTNQSDWLDIWVKKHHRTSNKNTNILFIWSEGFKTNLYCSDIVLIELDIMGKQWRLELGCYSCQQIHEPRQGTKGNTEKRNISYLRVKIKNESFIGKQTSRIFSLLWEPIHRPKNKERVNWSFE